MQVLKDAEQHLALATKERSYYSTIRKETRAQAEQWYSTPPLPGAAATPLSGPAVAMYSFDYAQQVCNDWYNVKH